jgi:hypothetical protein
MKHLNISQYLYSTKWYEITKKVRSYEKGTKLRKRYERATKRSQNKLPSYEKCTKLRIRYEVTKRYDATKKVRSCYEISYERSRLRSYQVTR